MHVLQSHWCVQNYIENLLTFAHICVDNPLLFFEAPVKH